MTGFADYARQIEEGSLDLMPLLAAAAELEQSGSREQAATLMRSWADRNDQHPLAHTVWFNLSGTLDRLGRRDEAAAALHEALRLNPDFPPAHINLGNILEQSGDRLGAAASWRALLNNLSGITRQAIDYKLTALKLLARLFADADLDADAEETLFSIIEIDPHQRDIMAYWINTRQRQCKWPLLDPLGPEDRRRALEAMAPLTLLSAEDDPIWHLARAAAFTQEHTPAPTGVLPARPVEDDPSARRLRVGYLSSDLCEHAVGYLTVDLFGQHDRAEIEVFAYYTGSRKDDATQTRIRAGVEHWRDIAALDDQSAAEAIFADGVDILVDLNGHTKDARLGVLAYRPAPVIVNWLGYPGSMGSLFHNYIIADETIIPPGDELYYSEQVLRLPCYQPVDRYRRIAEERPTRSDAGLPEGAMVYCCFNDPRKITEATWTAWMEILAAVPGSVLWLLIPSAGTRTRLQAMAEQAGIDPARLVLAERRLNPEHLARYPLADLVLDTFPYGAHTTASDALWMGVPVLTWAGRSFPSRVCASLVRAAGLPEMACDSRAAFIARAIELGRDPTMRDSLRRKLANGRDCLLFDTPRLARELESLYRRIWKNHILNKTPRPVLANLAVYSDVAMKLALGQGVGAADYPDDYRRALNARQGYTDLLPDGRLWPRV